MNSAHHVYAGVDAVAVSDRDRFKLLFGPYQAPPLKNGDRTFCLYRQQAVVAATWSDARIPWPRCCLRGGRPCGHGLLVDEELARAMRHESAAAVGYWWGVSRSTVQKWRRAFGVGRTNNEGTHRLVEAAVQAGMDSRHYRGRVWSREETALVGSMPDSEVARRTGRSRNAVSKKRRELERPGIEESRAAPRTRTEREG